MTVIYSKMYNYKVLLGNKNDKYIYEVIIILYLFINT